MQSRKFVKASLRGEAGVEGALANTRMQAGNLAGPARELRPWAPNPEVGKQREFRA